MLDNKDKFPTMMIDSKMVDLNSISMEELKELEEKLKQKQEELRKEIDKILEE